VGSSIVDAAWRPGSPLGWLAGDYPIVAVTDPAGVDRTQSPAGVARTESRPEPGVAHVVADLFHLPIADDSVDCVLLLDVLERLDDDRAALVEAARLLRSGGLLVTAVPVGPHLWSSHDQRAGHKRRYTGAGLTGALTDIGLVPEHLRYFQFLLLPLFAASRRRARDRPGALAREDNVSPGMNRVLAAVNRLETGAAMRIPWPTGSTVLGLGRKP